MEVYVPHIQQVVLQFQKWETGLSDISNDDPFVDRPLANGLEHQDTATALNDLAYLYTCQQRFQDAEPHGRWTLEIRKNVLGLSHEVTIISLHDLVHIYRKLGMEMHVTQLYLDAAKAGDRTAQKELACRYQDGIGVQMNSEAAIYWLYKFEGAELPEAPKLL
ncbi:hypothetical protein BC938DRAFT_480597 [Jimgerdemannia flammicorona]|uniref:Uncharacterized protein n=1 Tax=Jimgerdemannia flammicorona TaxID=994334 RepID=A0A433QIC6_9FUNG|nr:hypothetical protein BC938DRAFT_480597 [Jimgerdemannia flammicorona]